MSLKWTPGKRCRRFFFWIEAPGFYWCKELKKWVPQDETDRYSSELSFCLLYSGCQTVRAFRRHLRKHPELTVPARLLGLEVGIADVWATKRRNL